MTCLENSLVVLGDVATRPRCAESSPADCPRRLGPRRRWVRRHSSDSEASQLFAVHVAERTQEIAAGRHRPEKIIAASQLGSKAFSDLLYDRKSHPGPSNRCPRPNSDPLFLRAVGQRATAPHTELQHVCTRRSRARPPELRERHALSTMPCGRCYGSVGCVSRSGSNARSSAGLCARAYHTRATPAAAMAAPLRQRARGSPRRHVGGPRQLPLAAGSRLAAPPILRRLPAILADPTYLPAARPPDRCRASHHAPRRPCTPFPPALLTLSRSRRRCMPRESRPRATAGARPLGLRLASRLRGARTAPLGISRF